MMTKKQIQRSYFMLLMLLLTLLSICPSIHRTPLSLFLQSEDIQRCVLIPHLLPGRAPITEPSNCSQLLKHLVLSKVPVLPSPNDYGWAMEDKEWVPVMTDLAPVSKAIIELVKCNCAKTTMLYQTMPIPQSWASVHRAV